MSRGRPAADLARELATLTAGLGDGPVFVHCDLLHAGLEIAAGSERVDVLDAHLSVTGALSARGTWMPAFNYSFLRTGRFDARADPAEVGALAERFRTATASWRTPTPVFSISGTGVRPAPREDAEVDPFDERSDLAWLEALDGVVLFYGAPFGTATIIHLAERASGPVYRYDKRFTGSVRDGDRERGVTLLYHVRPLGRHLDYDWDRLLDEAVEAGVCRRKVNPLSRHVAASARGLMRYWRERTVGDPLYFLDAASRGWVAPLLDRLGRRFRLEDFEPSAIA